MCPCSKHDSTVSSRQQNSSYRADHSFSIGFRALQGIGGSGLYSLCYASILDVVPFRLMGPVSGAMSMASACSSVLGPVIGGAITSHTTWRVSNASLFLDAILTKDSGFSG
jgi:MFS family permease